MNRLPYGKSGLPVPEILNTKKCNCDVFDLPDSTLCCISNVQTEENRIDDAILSPVDRPAIDKWVNKNDNVVIIIPDITRKCPTSLLLSKIITKIENAKPDSIQILIANGNHRKVTDDEKKQLVGEAVYNKYKIYNHNSDAKGHYIGTTSSDNKVYINTIAAKADKVFLIGAANYHVFAGFSGGRKSILPGVCMRSTIMHNHKLMVGDTSLHENAIDGILNGNPVNEDMFEALKLFGTDKIFLLNVVTNVHNEILSVHAGCPIKAYENAVDSVKDHYKVDAHKKYDIVISCASGSPSDLCFYQAGKALEMTMHLNKNGGDFFIIAECIDGIGENEDIYTDWCRLNDGEFMNQFRTKYHNLGTGPYKINLLMQKNCTIYLVSDYDSSMADMLHMKSIVSSDFAAQLEKCIKGYNDMEIIPDIAVIPYGSHSALSLVF